MLEELIAFTNREDFWGDWHLRLEQAQFQQDTLTFLVSTKKDAYPPADDTLQWWRVECKGLVTESGIGRLNVPNYRIRLLNEHPLLWQYEEQMHLVLTGKVKSLPELLGEIFLKHIETCGNWLDFNGMVAGLHRRLQQEGEAEMLLPQRLLSLYQPILEKHGINVNVEPGFDGTPGLKMLLIGNPHMSEDNYRFGQVYIVAKEFLAMTVAPNRGLASVGHDE